MVAVAAIEINPEGAADNVEGAAQILIFPRVPKSIVAVVETVRVSEESPAWKRWGELQKQSPMAFSRATSQPPLIPTA